MATQDQTQVQAAGGAEAKQPHGGILVARRLKAHGVSKLFTLSGGHLFSIYDGCREEGIDLVDVRHESAAAFAAEGWAKVTREPGVAALTAGPGVTNGMSAIASAHKNNSPMLVLGGRAPQFRWGQGSLQEIDHVPFVAPLTKSARTATSTAEVPQLVDEALAATLQVPSSPCRWTWCSWRRTIPRAPPRCPTRPRCRPRTAMRSSASRRCSAQPSAR
jgi:acetolactate synthase-1/2/3 large subunit